MSTLRTMILLVFAVGLPAWALVSAPPMELARRGEPSRSARPPLVAPKLPTASITAVEPEAPTASPSLTPGSTPGADRFTAIQERLKELGSSYLLLETLGGAEGEYRFHCELAPLGDESLAQHFEATGRDPLVAMEEVLRAAESWTFERQRIAGREIGPRR